MTEKKEVLASDPLDALGINLSLTPAQLRDSETICNAATKGPWYEDGYRMYFKPDRIEPWAEIKHDDGYPKKPSYADLEFMAHARIALPDTLRCVKELKIEVLRLNEELLVIQKAAIKSALNTLSLIRAELRTSISNEH